MTDVFSPLIFPICKTILRVFYGLLLRNVDLLVNNPVELNFVAFSYF